MKRYFNPETLLMQPSAESEVFVRKTHADKVRKFLEKKRKKEEKQQKKLVKKMQKTSSAGKKYRGMGQQSTQDESSSQTGPVVKRFTKAQTIKVQFQKVNLLCESFSKIQFFSGKENDSEAKW